MRISSKVQKMLNRWHGEWNVYYEDVNAKKITSYNVFDHTLFKQYVVDSYSTSDTMALFSASMRHWAQYCFWSKCEYEIILSGWPPTPDNIEAEKVDIFDQLLLNWKAFIKNTWNSLEETFNNGRSHRGL